MDSRLMIIVLIAVLAAFGPSRCGCAPIDYRRQGGLAGRGLQQAAESVDGDTNPSEKLEMYVEHRRSEEYNLKLVDGLTTKSKNGEIDAEKYEVVWLPDDLSVTCKGGCPTQEQCDSSSAKSEATTSATQPQSREVPSSTTTTAKTTTCRTDPAEQQSSETQTPCCEKQTADRESSSPEVVVTRQSLQTKRGGWRTIESCTVKMTCLGRPTTTTTTATSVRAKLEKRSGDERRKNAQRRNLRKQRGFE